MKVKIHKKYLLPKTFYFLLNTEDLSICLLEFHIIFPA